MNRPLLYTYRRCPYAMRARMALLQSSIAFDAYEIVLRDKPAAMLAASLKGTVPVMLLPDGHVIDESRDIMHWAFGIHDPMGWWRRGETPENQALVALNDGPFKQQLDRYKYPGRFAGADPAVHRGEAVTCLLHPLEQRLANAAYLGEEAPCAADLAVFPFIRQFRAVDTAWFDTQPWPATQRWLHGWLESDLFNACMAKLPVGIATPFATSFAVPSALSTPTRPLVAAPVPAG